MPHMKKRGSQAERVINHFGNAYAMARLLEAATGKPVAPATVYRWTYPKSRGGTGGYIPVKWMKTIREVSGTLGIEIPEYDLRYD